MEELSEFNKQQESVDMDAIIHELNQSKAIPEIE